MPDWIVHFDGIFEPRQGGQGIATFGFVARHGNRRVGEGKGVLAGPGAPASANSDASAAASSPRLGAAVAEFGALVRALAWLEEHKRDDCAVLIRGDDRLAIETVAGRWKLSSPHLIPLRDAARDAIARLGVPVTLEKVDREANAEAERLSREAYHELKAAHPEWRLGRPAQRL